MVFQDRFSKRGDKTSVPCKADLLVLRKKLSNIFLIQAYISQIKKIFLNRFPGFCSVSRIGIEGSAKSESLGSGLRSYVLRNMFLRWGGDFDLSRHLKTNSDCSKRYTKER